ncbi:MAG: hypothetical protein JWR61_5796 [Ferruginibacter sp.]|uniref:hypothetical protein n=1 Tax=Ferruginibacter sp. TaxID=1940288 RepID=UPI002658D3F6|nr:hypothetical protein [Ferruginibacter sp.]MDB5280841.1 hypothetical protein [Ferruginibacter sp.]
MPDFRRGIAAMQEATDAQKGGNTPFPTFVREIQWRDDREEKFIAFLNRADDIPTVELHSFVPVGQGVSKAGKSYTKYEQFIDRRDPAIGDTSDDLTDRLLHKAQLRTIAVAVELEPTYAMVNGRKRPTGFEVKTETYSRKTEDGGMEEVEAPCIGIITQSPNNFYGWVGSFNESTAPIEETPLQVVRQGKDANTQYNFVPYLDQPIDYTNLFENISGVAYLRGELEGLDESGEPVDVACTIGGIMLNKRLNELADPERYERLVTPIQEIEDRFGGGNKVASRPVAAPRQSQRAATTQSAGASTAKFNELRKMHETA